MLPLRSWAAGTVPALLAILVSLALSATSSRGEGQEGAVFRAISSTEGTNLVPNAHLEDGDAAPLPGINFYEKGYGLAPGQGVGGSRAIVCTNEEPGDHRGAQVVLLLQQDEPKPLLVSGFSRSENVSGSPNPDYSIYCDLIYDDGSPLWGQTGDFDTGSHDWQRVQFVIYPQRPVARLYCYALFREHTGTVWFDNLHVSQLETAGSFDGQPVGPGTAYPGPAERAAAALSLPGGPAIGLAADGSIASVSVPSEGSPKTQGEEQSQVLRRDTYGGFFAHDAAEGSDWLSILGVCRRTAKGAVFRGDCRRLDLSLQADYELKADHIEVSGRITDLSGRDRAVTLYFGLPVAADGWSWWDDMTTARPVARQEDFRNLVRCDAGANGHMSRYPMGCLTPPIAPVKGPRSEDRPRPAAGIALAYPMRQPRLARIGVHGPTGLSYIAFDFGLSAKVRAMPSAADFRFVIYGFKPTWGWRAAWRNYMDIFPEDFVKRVPREGIWMAFLGISGVQGYDDFGFAFKEGDRETAWDDEHGYLSFRYTEPQSFWCAMPEGADRSYEGCVRAMEQQAAGGNKLAAAALTSGVYGPNGRYDVDVRDTSWCVGSVFSVNPGPFLDEEVTKAKVNYTPEDADRRYADTTEGVLDGEYLDSLEGWAVLNYRPDHIAEARVPPVFDSRGRICLQNIFNIWEFCRYISEDIHRRGKLMMANWVPWRFGFLMGWFDVAGTETNWKREGQYRPDSEEIMNYRRALSGKKPYLLLMNTDFRQWTYQDTERYMRRCLHYAVFPSFFSGDASSQHYFSQPELYNRDRALFRRYVPLINEIAAAGWEPVTLARCDNPAVRVERYGSPSSEESMEAGGKTFYLTLLNTSEETVSATVTVYMAELGVTPGRWQLTDVLENRPQAPISCQPGVDFTIQLRGGDTGLVRLEPTSRG